MARLRYRPASLVLRTLLRTLGADLRPVLAWLAFCGLLLAATWAWTAYVVLDDKQQIRSKLHATAAADAKAYAVQLERSLSQVDYIMLSQKYHYEKAGGAIDLEEQTQAGLVPPTSELIMTVVDAGGNPVTSTLPFKSIRTNIADHSYFREHKQHANLGLTIARPSIGLRLRREVILLARRLDGPKGLFAGLIVVAIEPAYLGSHLGDEALQPGDLVAAYRADWAFLAGDPHTVDVALGPGVAGTAEMAGDHYRDGKVRVLAWHKAKGYPLFAAVALSEESRLSAYGERERELYMSALFASLALLLAAGGGAAWLLWNASRKLHRQELRAAYRLATENADAGFFMLRPLYGPEQRIADFTIEDCNEYGAAAAGLARHQLVGQKLSTLRGRGYMKRHLQACEAAMRNGVHEDVLRLPEPGTGSVRWMHRRFIRSGLGLAATIRDVSAARAHEQKLHQQANIDALTSLPNRFWLMKQLPAALDQARSAGSMLAVLFIDLDDFKNLNDTQGHAAGDELLRACARRLRSVLREGDGVARLGGDEFTMILQAPGGEDEIAKVARRVVDQLRQPFALGAGRHVVSASVGISVFPHDGEDGATLLKHADIAMYAAKESGKSQYSFFHARLSDRLLDRLTRQAELRRAVEQQDLVLYYQPRVDARTGELAGLEALLRWSRPQHGSTPPDEFIPLAEETGLILPLGDQVIDMACRQLALWKAAGARLVPVSVNVAGYQLERQEVAALIAAALQRHGVEPALLEVEVAGSATVERGTAAAAVLVAIKALGVRVYVDDFGTGYSSLSQLKRLDMDGLKVDRAFTASLTQGDAEVALFRAIVSIGHAIGTTIVAEGVETAAQLAILQELGCDEVQGYFVSRPVAPDAALALLEKRFLFP